MSWFSKDKDEQSINVNKNFLDNEDEFDLFSEITDMRADGFNFESEEDDDSIHITAKKSWFNF